MVIRGSNNRETALFARLEELLCPLATFCFQLSGTAG
jgi:hypothetical protein